jgi:hypothetical protein
VPENAILLCSFSACTWPVCACHHLALGLCPDCEFSAPELLKLSDALVPRKLFLSEALTRADSKLE